MKWSWRLGRVAGIDINVHWTFLLLLVWIGGAFFLQGGSLLAAARAVAVVLSFFVCIVMHEYGHALTARRFGVDTQDITLLPIGGVARLEKFPKEPWQEFWIAVAGPAVNVAIAIGVALILAVQGRLGQSMPDFETLTATSYLRSLLWFNILVVAFNMLPAFPMDGGRVLRAILASRGSYTRATRTAANVGQIMAILFGVIGLFTNPLLLFIAIFVYLGAEAEARMVEVTAAIENVPVREAMMTYFRSLAPDDTLSDAAAALLAGAQQDFPVVDHQGKLVGLLRRRDLIRAMHENSTHLRVGDAMETQFERATVDEMVEDVLMHMKRSSLDVMPVVRDAEVVGLLTLENIGELVMIRAAMRGEEAAPTDVRELTGAV